jgi:hypothetical protein
MPDLPKHFSQPNRRCDRGAAPSALAGWGRAQLKSVLCAMRSEALITATRDLLARRD